jgi:hypothetical protein
MRIYVIKVSKLTKLGLKIGLFVGEVFLLWYGYFCYLFCPSSSFVSNPSRNQIIEYKQFCVGASGQHIDVFITPFQNFMSDWGLLVIIFFVSFANLVTWLALRRKRMKG